MSSYVASEVAEAAPLPSSDTLARLRAEMRAGRSLAAANLAARAARGDVNRATDLLFYARHPERRGRALRRGETAQIREWLSLRDRHVRPLLTSAQPSQPPTSLPAGAVLASAFSRLVPAARRWALLVPLLDRYRGDIPLEFLLGWIAVESDGRIDEVTRPPLDERGFFQISRAESAEAHPPIEHLRLTTDPDYSVRAGIQLVRSYADYARSRFPWIPASSGLFWRVVKLQHAMGRYGVLRLLNAMRARGISTTWDAIKRFEVTDGPRLLALLRVEPLGRFGRNVDQVFKRGPAIARSLGR